MKSLYLTRFIAVLLLFMAACSGTESLSDRQIDRPENLVYPELNEFQLPDVEQFEINGIRFFVVEDREVPLINMNAVIKAGRWMEPENKVGLASMTGEIMRSGGTVNIPADELNEMLENRAANMEISMGTSSGSARMNVLKEDFEPLLPVFIELLTQPAFPEDKLELSKTQRRSAISRRNDDPSGIAGREFRKLIYGDSHVYNGVQEYDHLNNIERADLVAFHADAINANNLMVGIVGDFDTDELRQVLEKHFGEIERGAENEFDFPEINYSFEPGINFIPRNDMNQAIIRMGHIGGFRDNPDYAALQVMNQVLSGGFSGRLLQEVRTRRGLAYSVGGSYGSNVLYPGQFFSGLSTEGAQAAEAITATRNEIKRLQDEPVTQEELDDVRDQFLNSLVFRDASLSAVLSRQVNNAYLGLPLDAFEQYVEGVREVTPADIQRVAQEYLRPDDFQILVVGNPEQIGDQLEQFGEVNEINVSIPRPGESDVQEVISGDSEMGREWMMRMAEAVSGGQNIRLLELEGSIALPQLQGQSVNATVRYNFAENSLRQEINTPMGTQTLLLENGSAFIEGGGQRQNLGAEMAETFQKALNMHYVNLAANAGNLNADYLGEETVEGQQTVVVYLHDMEMKLFLHADSSLPVKTAYSTFNPQAGGNVEIEVMYDDWTSADGVTAAYSEVQFSDGNQQSASSYTTHSAE